MTGMDDIKVDVFGGDGVGVRVTHTPTGTVASEHAADHHGSVDAARAVATERVFGVVAAATRVPVKVYLVTSGSYSDYRIDSAWSTREAAEDEVRKINLRAKPYRGDEGAVEEWELDGSPSSEPVPMWEVKVRGGDLRSPQLYLQEEPVMDGGEYGILPWWDTGTPPAVKHDMARTVIVRPERPAGWRGSAWGDSPEAAMKVARERTALVQANEMGI